MARAGRRGQRLMIWSQKAERAPQIPRSLTLAALALGAGGARSDSDSEAVGTAGIGGALHTAGTFFYFFA